MNFTQICEAFDEVSKISSTNEKVAWLKAHDDPDFKEVLAWYLDNSRVTGIAEKKFTKVAVMRDPEMTTQDQKTFSDVIRYLDCHNTGRDEDVAYVKWLGTQITTSLDSMTTFQKLVCKNFPMGLKDGLVNKAFPGLVPTYEVMLADRYYDLKDNQKAKIFNGREFVLQEKLDGFRLTVHKENGNVRCVSRQGKLITGLVDIENDVRNMVADNFVLDGEVLLTDREGIPSKLQYKATSKIVSSKDPEKHGVTLNAFDWVSTAMWKTQDGCGEPYSERYDSLKKTLHATNPKNIQLCENIYTGSDMSKIDELIVPAKAKEWEGLMVRFTDSEYAWKRSKDLLKVKPFKELDAYIVGYEEGTNNNAGKLGAFLCEVEYEGKKLSFKVGGGYSDEERVNFWTQKDELVGRVMSVQYFEITQNTTTMEYSVRFPEFLELKEEGSTINN